MRIASLAVMATMGLACAVCLTGTVVAMVSLYRERHQARRDCMARHPAGSDLRDDAVASVIIDWLIEQRIAFETSDLESVEDVVEGWAR